MSRKEVTERDGRGKGKRRGTTASWEGPGHVVKPGSRGQTWAPVLTLPFTNLELPDKPFNLSKLHRREIIILLISWGCPKSRERSKILGTEPTMW